EGMRGGPCGPGTGGGVARRDRSVDSDPDSLGGRCMGAPMIRPMSRAPRAGFRVGDRVHHKEFGEGLIVEVRERDGFEVLEIAFPDGIRRLSSFYPLETARWQARARPGQGIAAPPPSASEPASAPLSGGLAVPARSQFRVAGGSEELFQRLVTGPYDDPRDFDLRLRIERFSLHRGFDRLLSLDLL